MGTAIGYVQRGATVEAVLALLVDAVSNTDNLISDLLLMVLLSLKTRGHNSDGCKGTTQTDARAQLRRMRCVEWQDLRTAGLSMHLLSQLLLAGEIKSQGKACLVDLLHDGILEVLAGLPASRR